MMRIVNDDGYIIKALVKGSLIGALIGGIASYASSKEVGCDCRNVRKKTAYVMRGAGRLLNKAANKVY